MAETAVVKLFSLFQSIITAFLSYFFTVLVLTIVDPVSGDSVILISPPLSKLNITFVIWLVEWILRDLKYLQQPNQIAEYFCSVV